MSAARVMRFGEIEIAYDENVLEPRPWTVMQADWARELEPSLPDGAFLELGCGAGHIGLASIYGTERHLVQLDAEGAACELASLNASAAGMGERVSVRCGAFGDTLLAGEAFALVLADPPYVPTSETSRYPEDPPQAIDGGADGLDGIRSALAVAGAHLLPGGAVLLQVWGAAQAEQSREIALRAGLVLCEVRAADRHRAVVLLRPIV
ncbi:MAG: methyltransferase [Acidimicrobiia bacterium]